MEEKKLVRKNGKIAGVCGGLASHFGIDATIIRIIWLILASGAGSGLLVYLVMWIVMPKEKVQVSEKTSYTTKENAQ